jgi:hypothetical protein
MPPSVEISRRDNSLIGRNSQLAEEMGLASAEWYACPIPRPRLKELMRRKDGPAIRDTLLWFALLPNLEAHLGWWRQIAAHRRAEGCALLPVCPEFGPPPYMTLLPRTHTPIADLWEINCYLRDWLKERL